MPGSVPGGPPGSPPATAAQAPARTGVSGPPPELFGPVSPPSSSADPWRMVPDWPGSGVSSSANNTGSPPEAKPGRDVALPVQPGANGSLVATGRRRLAGPDDPDHPQEIGGRRRASKSRMLLLVVLVLAGAAGVFTVSQMLTSRGTSAGNQSARGASLPLPTKTRSTPSPSASAPAATCPAAAVPGVSTACPVTPECWGGMVVTAGSATAALAPCTSAHVWQTFAIGTLPASVYTYNQGVVSQNPVVRSVCSMTILLASRNAAVRSTGAAEWTIAVLPPDRASYNSGARSFRCLASVVPVTGVEQSSSQFGG